MARYMAAADHARVKNGLSVRAVCDSARIGKEDYHDYLSGRKSIPINTLLRVYEAVGLRLFVADVSIDKDFSPTQWSIMSLFFDSRKTITYEAFSKATNIRVETDAAFYKMLKLAMFYVFFYRTFTKIPNYTQCETEMGNVDTKYMQELCVEYDLLTIDLYPTSRSQETYDVLAKEIQRYLVTANLLYDIHK